MSHLPPSKAPDPDTAWREHNLSQLRYFKSLSLRSRLEAVQGMADVIRRFEQMRRDGKFRSKY
jgi:hypothetical protein